MPCTQTVMILTKDDVTHIREQISLHCHWSDKVMNHLDDFFALLDFEENTVLQVSGKIISTEPPQFKQVQKQRKQNEP